MIGLFGSILLKFKEYIDQLDVKYRCEHYKNLPYWIQEAYFEKYCVWSPCCHLADSIFLDTQDMYTTIVPWYKIIINQISHSFQYLISINSFVSGVNKWLANPTRFSRQRDSVRQLVRAFVCVCAFVCTFVYTRVRVCVVNSYRTNSQALIK